MDTTLKITAGTLIISGIILIVLGAMAAYVGIAFFRDKGTIPAATTATKGAGQPFPTGFWASSDTGTVSRVSGVFATAEKWYGIYIMSDKPFGASLLIGTAPCGNEIRIRSGEVWPTKSVQCPCGNPNHLLWKIEDAEIKAP